MNEILTKHRNTKHGNKKPQAMLGVIFGYSVMTSIKQTALSSNKHCKKGA
jgi:hypothetical protein